jgi:hypothetical protein
LTFLYHRISTFPGKSSLLLTFGLIGKEVVDFRNCTVECADGEAMVCSIENDVLTHDGQSDQAELCLDIFGITIVGARWLADIDAGKASAGVSLLSTMDISENSRARARQNRITTKVNNEGSQEL